MKRERENPCGVCGHYHKYEAGEVCGECGHRMPEPDLPEAVHVSAFPSEIIPNFIYLGSYHNASRSELLKYIGISRILNTVPACQNLNKNSVTYHCLKDGPNLQFDDAIEFLEKCQKEKVRVLVHCMSGRSRLVFTFGQRIECSRKVFSGRSPAIVIAYLMKNKAWRLSQSYQWVKDRRPSVELSQAVLEQLQEYEKKIVDRVIQLTQNFSFGLPKVADLVPAPTFNNIGGSNFALPLDIPPSQFQFGASIPHINGGDLPMDS